MKDIKDKNGNVIGGCISLDEIPKLDSERLCYECDVHLGFFNGRKKYDDKHYCKKCYYKIIGNEIEKHPIGVK